MNKRALVVAGGESINLTTLVKMINRSDLVVAADSGAEHLLRAGTVPHAVIGDLDSCDKSMIDRIKETKCEFVKLSQEKDITDTEAAIDYCVDKGYERIDVTCVLKGKRLDHLFGNVFLLPKYVKKGVRVRLIDDNNRFLEAINDNIKFSGQSGTFVSLIPLTDEVSGVSTRGLKYPLVDAKLDKGNTLGISNEIVEKEVEIEVTSGTLLIVREKD
ncbi:MAG: thiamine diphosphokinase [Clostridia bacterium]